MRRLLLFAALVCAASLSVLAQDSGDHPIIKRGMDAKYGPVPGLPDCATVSPQHGDPSQGAAVLLMQLEAGCTIPWHWHTASESLFPVSGLLQVQAIDGKPVVLKSGDYGYMPGKHVHLGKCAGSKPCSFFLEIDAALDIHYVDKAGKEITPDVALASVNKPPKNPGEKSAQH